VAPYIGAKITRMPGVTVQVTDRCIGCGTCAQDVCFVNAIRVVDGHAVISSECRGCGRCITVCPQGAIEISIEKERFVAESVARIAPLVDVS
jgi:MinD superfamily P-loop ATPase